MRDFSTAKTKSICLEAAQIQFGACMVSELTLLDIAAISERTLGTKFEQPPLSDHLLRQTEERMRLSRVLGQSVIARLLVSKDVLDDMKRILYLQPITGFKLLGLLGILAQMTGFRLGQRTALTEA